MKTNSYKYIVTVETDIWLDGSEEIVASESQTIEFNNDDLLLAREAALEKADTLEDMFNDPEEKHPYPPIKWNEDWKEENPDRWMFYQITVDLVGENETHCIYDTGGDPNGLEETEAKVINGLIKEYEIYKKNNFNISDFQESITCLEKGNKKEAKILDNTFLDSLYSWDIAKVETDIDYLWQTAFANLSFDDRKKAVGVAVSKRKKITFKAHTKHTIPIKDSIIEIAIRTTGESIPSSMQENINKLIKKWQKM